ncbi:MAG TPA: PTS sugar transporter subunit IIA, partial [Gemmatimonadaceae bacterium]|nr:PTS sugar transporter subunit IIA [Gemmatimonadaceae bacterium]
MRANACNVLQRHDLTHVAANVSLADSRNISRRAGIGRLRQNEGDTRSGMELREFFSEDAVKLDLEGTTKDDVLKELIGLLGLDEKNQGMLFKMLKRRENLGSTGIGRGIAIPHCRSLVVSKLRVAFGRKRAGVDFRAIDDKPVH